MTGSLTVGYQNDTLLNFLLTSSGYLVSDNFVCLHVCLPVCICHLTCSFDWGYIFQQGETSPWLNTFKRWFGSAKILPVSQLFLSIQRNFCPFEFHPLQPLTKAGDTVKFY